MALLIATIGALRRISLWRRGRRARVNVLAGLLAIPRRYLVNVHEVVVRDRFSAAMHVSVAGGFVLVMLLALPVHLAGLGYPWLHGLLPLGVAAMVACPNCITMLEGVVQPRLEVRDVAELLAEAVQS